MKRELYLTADGSHTIAIPEMQVTYHSVHGAIQESKHVYIQAGLEQIKEQEISIFEMGFGTGLNALLTYEYAQDNNKNIYYHSVERFPLKEEELENISYQGLVFHVLHNANWDEEVLISPFFTLYKSHTDLRSLRPNRQFHLIYYDAFAPAAQPELWEQQLFERLYTWLLPGGILVTYCSKGIVRRAMQAAGFVTERLPGPPGKREILRAIKPTIS